VGIEGNNCRLRHRIRRAFRNTCHFSKIIRNLLNAFNLAFFYINFGYMYKEGRTLFKSPPNKAMQNYKSGSHPRYDIKYHTVWIGKYRKPIMAGTVAERLRELIRQTCMQKEVTIKKGHVSKGHIHILVSCSPGLAVSKLVQKQKGASSHKLFEEFAHLRKQYWRQH
jgi:putative transposase